MDKVIDFKRQRAILKSGIKDVRVIDEMIEQRLDPCDKDHYREYCENKAIDFFFEQFKQDVIQETEYSLEGVSIHTGEYGIKYINFEENE